MTDHMTHEAEHVKAQPVRPAKLNLALLALLDELHDDVQAMFPTGRADSDEHVAQFDAMRSAFSAIDAVLTALPDRTEFRAMVRDYVSRAWELTGGDPAHDSAVERALKRAVQDYMPAVPEQRKRGQQVAADEVPTELPKGKRAGKP